MLFNNNFSAFLLWYIVCVRYMAKDNRKEENVLFYNAL